LDHGIVDSGYGSRGDERSGGYIRHNLEIRKHISLAQILQNVDLPTSTLEDIPALPTSQVYRKIQNAC